MEQPGSGSRLVHAELTPGAPGLPPAALQQEAGLRIAIVDESPARAAVIEEGLREAGLSDVAVLIERTGLVARIAALSPDVADEKHLRTRLDLLPLAVGAIAQDAPTLLIVGEAVRGAFHRGEIGASDDVRGMSFRG